MNTISAYALRASIERLSQAGDRLASIPLNQRDARYYEIAAMVDLVREDLLSATASPVLVSC